MWIMDFSILEEMLSIPAALFPKDRTISWSSVSSVGWRKKERVAGGPR